jgi:hypothetical protein
VRAVHRRQLEAPARANMARQSEADGTRHTITPFSPQLKLKQLSACDITESLSSCDVDDDVVLAHHFEVRGSYNMVVGKMMCDESA